MSIVPPENQHRIDLVKERVTLEKQLQTTKIHERKPIQAKLDEVRQQLEAMAFVTKATIKSPANLGLHQLVAMHRKLA